MLPLDVQIELFDRMITPILLFGCEVWCPSMSDLASKLQLRFYKIIMKVRRTTPTRMVYGELGQFPLELQAKGRLLSFWFNLVNIENSNKLSSVLYKFLHQLYSTGIDFGLEYKSPYLAFIESTLNGLGLSGMWLNQFDQNVSLSWFKAKIKQSLRDQYIQQWRTDVDRKEIFYVYRLYKPVFKYEQYFVKLPSNLVYPFLRFRTLNHKLPIQSGRKSHIPRNERLCPKCNMQDIGDEFHYVLVCPYFTEMRKKYIALKYYQKPNTIKFLYLFCDSKRRQLVKLAIFVNMIMKEF